MSLPPKLGGLGIPIFSEIADHEFNNSVLLSNDLSTKIQNQQRKYDPNNKTQNVKNKIKATKQQRYKIDLDTIRLNLNEEQKRLNDLNVEQGASSWLTTLPIKEKGYILNKQLFWDLIRIRYGWMLTRLPNNCECGASFDLQHALSCKKGGFFRFDITTLEISPPRCYKKFAKT